VARPQAQLSANDRAIEVELAKSEALWGAYARRKNGPKDEAARRLRIIQEVHALVENGASRVEAIATVLPRHGVKSPQTFYSWEARVVGLHRSDWLAALAPHYVNVAPEAECSPKAWELLKTLYLTESRAPFKECLRRVREAAQESGWTLPSARTLMRRIKAIPWAIRKKEREGTEALRRSVPAQRRSRAHFHALEAVNADGYKWDVRVRWPDGEICLPMMVSFQDLYSNLILSWRVDRSENKDSVRLAFGDLVELWGVPDHVYLDNGRGFASKWITGGTPTRYRFKVKAEEPDGIMTQLGCAVHWTTPYHGQSKPIERAHRDFAQNTGVRWRMDRQQARRQAGKLWCPRDQPRRLPARGAGPDHRA
jgi:hypothetical protein